MGSPRANFGHFQSRVGGAMMGGCKTHRIRIGMGGSNEPWRIFNLEIHRGLGVQVPAFPENRHSAHEERTAAQIGGMDFEVVWILTAGSMYH
jgi:hypothetical protein